jgi:hypothetical protein
LDNGAIVGLDIFFFSFITGSAINPMRYLAPAVLSGYVGDVWLYWTATFVGSAIVAMIYRKTILSKSKMIQRKKSNLLSVGLMIIIISPLLIENHATR